MTGLEYATFIVPLVLKYGPRALELGATLQKYWTNPLPTGEAEKIAKENRAPFEKYAADVEDRKAQAGVGAVNYSPVPLPGGVVAEQAFPGIVPTVYAKDGASPSPQPHAKITPKS